jgi:hypothetical protein
MKLNPQDPQQITGPTLEHYEQRAADSATHSPFANLKATLEKGRK